MKFRSSIVLISIFTLLCMAFTACSAKAEPAKELDLSLLQTQIAALKSDDGQALYHESEALNAEQLMSLYEIDTNLMHQYLVFFDSNYNFFMALQPLDGKTNEIKNSVSAALTNLETQLELYDPEQNARVKERLETVRGGFLIYVASADNDAVIDAVDKQIES